MNIEQDFETVKKWLFQNHEAYCLLTQRNGALDRCVCTPPREALSRIEADMRLGGKSLDTMTTTIEAERTHKASYIKALRQAERERDALRAALEKLRTAAQVFHDSHAFIPQDEGDSHWCRLCETLKELEEK